jgi:Uma2 family endonuclease
MIGIGLLAGRQVELIDGQIIDMSPELPIHRATYRRAVKYLEGLLGSQAIVFATASITLPDHGEPQPDIAILIPPESCYETRYPGSKDIYWLIEVSNSTLDYDLSEKAQIYARSGIPEYWVLDIPGSRLWVHRQPQAGAYRSLVQYASGQVNPAALLDVTVAVERLLR